VKERQQSAGKLAEMIAKGEADTGSPFVQNYAKEVGVDIPADVDASSGTNEDLSLGGTLDETQQNILSRLSPKERKQTLAQLLVVGERQKGITDRANDAADRAAERQKKIRDEKPIIELLPQAQKSTVFEIETTKPLLQDLAKEGERLSKKYGSLDSRALAKVDPGSKLGQFFANVKLNTQFLTKAVQGSRPSDYDAKIFGQITGGSDVMASPGDIAKLIRQVDKINDNRKNALLQSAANMYGRTDTGTLATDMKLQKLQELQDTLNALKAQKGL